MNNVEYIEIEKLKPFENHPYKVKNDEEMENLIESIREHGILSPIIARPIENNEYEIISGHRRLFAGKRAGISKVPALVTQMDRDTAAFTLVDSNLHRENILPSEKAFAYKLKLEALSHQGKRTDLTLAQTEPKSSAELIGEKENICRETVKRYIRLTNLLPTLLEFVDIGRIAFTPAVELSYLNDIEQQDLLEIIESEESTPSLSQAVRLKKLCQKGLLTDDKILEIMSEEKANQKERIKIPTERIRKYFPQSYSNSQIENEIVKLCEAYYKRTQKKHSSQER